MKILVADDDRMSRLVLANLLGRWGYEVTAVADGDAAWEALAADGGPRLAVLDWKMPGREGPQICRELRASERPGYFYVVLLTSQDQGGQIVEGMESGADDYVVKPFEPEELRVRLRAGRRILELEAELTASREAFRALATYDALTGVFSRRAILEILDRELVRARRNQAPVAVALADVDHFKRVNDTHGHHTGDVVLVEVARRLGSTLRESDGLGRVGGEEFLVVLPGAERDAALMVTERLRELLCSEPVPTAVGPLTVTASFGVATSGGDVSADVLVSRADKALYLAKEEGRNRVRSEADFRTQDR